MPIRELPNNIEAEQAVLGSMFLSKTALQKACDNLNEDIFYLKKNGMIFKSIKELVDKNIPIDITTVTDELKNKNIINEVGGVEYLTEILDCVPSAANFDYYSKIIEDKAILRNLIEVSTSITTLGYEEDNEINETVEEAERRILNISKNRKTSEFKSIQDVMKSTQENLIKLSEMKGEITGIPTGWTDIDKITSGFHENELIIIAARPAMGKTAFACNLATNMATRTDKSVALFNLEMGAEQLALRIIASLGQIDQTKLRTGKLDNNDWKRVTEAVAQLQGANIFIDDTPGITIGEIRSKCRRLAASEKGLGAVIIDYLQLISGNGKYGANRQQEVSDISRALKTMAMELKVPVIALAQLSRAVEQREDKRPIMSDLRESGSIEQDADIVSFLYREDYYNKQARDDSFTSVSEFIIGKHRSGPTATIELLFKRNTSTFVNYMKGTRGEENE